MKGSGLGLTGWVATCLMVTTVSTVLLYSPKSLAASGCTLTPSRAEQIENGLKATGDGQNLEAVGLGFGVAGIVILTLGALFTAPVVALFGAAYLVAAGAISGIGLAQTSSATQPQGSCETGFANLPDPQRQEVIALLDKGDTSDAMALVDAGLAGTALPPGLLRYYAAEANGFGGSRTAPTTAAVPASAGPGSSGGQNR